MERPEHQNHLTLLHSERPKLHRVLAVLSAIGLNDFGAQENKQGTQSCSPFVKMA